MGFFSIFYKNMGQIWDIFNTKISIATFQIGYASKVTATYIKKRTYLPMLI